jgi:hypothetical protein
MGSGTTHIEQIEQLAPRMKRHSVFGNVLHQSRTSYANAQLRLASSEVRETAKSLRELLLWDLREAGYSFREIGELLGITKQRASQIERKMVARATARSFDRAGHHLLKHRRNAICSAYHVRVLRITGQEFESRLDAINRSYTAKFDRILERGYKRKRFADCSGAYETTEFWKLWPLIERYHRKPFCFSKLVSDFPQLANQPHLPQLLSRLRRTALLQKVGLVKVGTHNLPEILMAEAPIEQHVAATIEKLVVSWSRKLQRLQSEYRPIRPTRSIELTRQWLIERLLAEGVSRAEVVRVMDLENEALAPWECP